MAVFSAGCEPQVLRRQGNHRYGKGATRRTPCPKVGSCRGSLLTVNSFSHDPSSGLAEIFVLDSFLFAFTSRGFSFFGRGGFEMLWLLFHNHKFPTERSGPLPVDFKLHHYPDLLICAISSRNFADALFDRLLHKDRLAERAK